MIQSRLLATDALMSAVDPWADIPTHPKSAVWSTGLAFDRAILDNLAILVFDQGRSLLLTGVKSLRPCSALPLRPSWARFLLAPIAQRLSNEDVDAVSNYFGSLGADLRI